MDDNDISHQVPYQVFSARDYLDLYYDVVGSEGDGLLNFLISTLSHLPDNLKMLEFGGGPTIITLMAVAPKAAEITFTDYVPENREVVSRWLAGDESDFDWTAFIERTLQLEGNPAPARRDIHRRAQLVREKVKAVLPCDIYQTPPLEVDETFDLIISNYTLDAITTDKALWHDYIRNLLTLLEPGGMLILASLRESEASYLSGLQYPNVYLHENDVYDAMVAVGMIPDSIRVESADADHAERDYSGVIFSSAIKPSSDDAQGVKSSMLKSAQTQAQYKRILVDGVHYYGKHLILSASGCNENLLELSYIKRFMRELVDQIDMVAYGEPLAARFGQGIEEGISAVQLIETSAITIHTNDMARDLYLDVFSCKGYNEDDVVAFVTACFAPTSMNYQALLRK